MTTEEDIGKLNFPSVGYLTLFDVKVIKDKLSQFPKVEPLNSLAQQLGFSEQWNCSGVNSYYKSLEQSHELRFEGSNLKKVNDLFQELRKLMIDEHGIYQSFKEAIIIIWPGLNDSEDIVEYGGEFGNILQGDEAKPNPNIATENIIFEIAKKHCVKIPTGEMLTRQVSDVPSRYSGPFDRSELKYLVTGPIFIRGTVNRVVNTAIELRDASKKRIFENLSVYDSESRLIKGLDRGAYVKKSAKQKGKPVNYYTV